MRSLWQILVAIWEKDLSADLTCDECFRYMEHLAEEAIAGADPSTLRKAVRDHLITCPDCREHHLDKLERMGRIIPSEQDSRNSGEIW